MTPPLSLRWTALPQNGLPSTPLFLLTSMAMRTVCLSRVVQRALRMVTAKTMVSTQTPKCLYFAVLISFPFLVEEGVGLSDAQGRLYLNKMFHISANKMFELLFTDSNFVRRFMDIRKIFSKCKLHWNSFQLLLKPVLSTVILAGKSYWFWSCPLCYQTLALLHGRRTLPETWRGVWTTR